jgi:hypothetical protein
MIPSVRPLRAWASDGSNGSLPAKQGYFRGGEAAQDAQLPSAEQAPTPGAEQLKTSLRLAALVAVNSVKLTLR